MAYLSNETSRRHTGSKMGLVFLLIATLSNGFSNQPIKALAAHRSRTRMSAEGGEMPLGRNLHPRPKALPRDSSHVDFNLPDKIKNTAWKVIMTLGGDTDNQGKNWPLELGFECTLREDGQVDITKGNRYVNEGFSWKAEVARKFLTRVGFNVNIQGISRVVPDGEIYLSARVKGDRKGVHLERGLLCVREKSRNFLWFNVAGILGECTRVVGSFEAIPLRPEEHMIF